MKILRQRITVREGNRTRTVDKLHAFFLTLANDALRGDKKASTLLIALMRTLGMTEERHQAGEPEAFSVDDQSLLDDYFRRQYGENAPSEVHGNSNKNDSTGGASVEDRGHKGKA